MNRFKLILLTLALALGACLPQAKSPLDHVVASGSVALLALDSLEAERLRAIEHPTEQDVADAQVRADRLSSIRDALTTVASSGDLEGHRAQIALAVRLLRVALDQARSESMPVPEQAEHALVMAETWLSTQGVPDG